MNKTDIFLWKERQASFKERQASFKAHVHKSNFLRAILGPAGLSTPCLDSPANSERDD